MAGEAALLLRVGGKDAEAKGDTGASGGRDLKGPPKGPLQEPGRKPRVKEAKGACGVMPALGPHLSAL